MLDTVKRKLYAQRAARLLNEEEVAWTSGYWVRDTLTDDQIGNSDMSMGNVRNWLRSHGLIGPRNKRNRQCYVCAEGALMIAMAEDPTIPDEMYADRLLRSFYPSAARAAAHYGWMDDAFEWEEDAAVIPTLNDDSGLNRSNVITLLERMSIDAE